MFYDSEKTTKDNDESLRKTRQNKEAIQMVTSCLALFTTALGLAIAVKKAKEEFF
jgi:hypothetical protein